MNGDIERITDEARAFLDLRRSPDVRRAVMSRIEDLDPLPAPRAGVLTRLVTVLWAPRRVSIRPVFALSAAGAVVALLTFSQLRQESQQISHVTPEVVEVQAFVQFRLDAAASRVQLAGSFTNWAPSYDMRQAAPGIWTITVPLAQGVHDYAFVVDGTQWMPDPYGPRVSDGFGGMNSRLTLLWPVTQHL